jgi:hypothetical protein
MAEPSLLPILVGGIFSVAAAAAGAAVGHWRGRQQSTAEVAKTVSEAAQLSVEALSQVVDQLNKENARLKGNLGRGRDVQRPWPEQ